MREATSVRNCPMYNATDSGDPQPAAKRSLLRNLFAVRPVQARDCAGAERLKQTLSAWSLMSIGIGATVGTGVFVLTGTVAANQSGPAITLSLLIAAFGSALAALCYAEFAAFLPVPGSAYSYTYATLGEAIAWFIGWNLLLEYGISASAVAVSWSAYVVNLLAEAHIHLPAILVNAPLQAERERSPGRDRRHHQCARGAHHRGDELVLLCRHQGDGQRHQPHGGREGWGHRASSWWRA